MINYLIHFFKCQFNPYLIFHPASELCRRTNISQTGMHWDKRGRGKLGSPQEKSLIFHVGYHQGTRLRRGLGAQMFNGGHIRPLLNISAPSPFVPESPRSPICPGVSTSPVVSEFFGVPAGSDFRSGFSPLPRQRTIPFPVWIRRIL